MTTSASPGNTFDHSEFNLDYAYAKHKWNDYSMTLGQMVNPFVTTWTMTDADVRLTGLTLAYGAKEGVFATVGAFGAQNFIVSGKDDNTGMMYQAQVGYKDKFSDKGKYTVAIGYQTYDQEYINQSNNITGNIDENEYGLDIGDLYGDVSFPAGPVNLKLYGHMWMNFGADGAGSQAGSYFPESAEDNDMGWVVGLEGNVDQFHFGYAYAYVEADSYYGYLSDADFGMDKTNKKGHKANIGYDVTKNWAVDLNFWYAERIEELTGGTSVDYDDKTTYQVDVSYKF